MDLQLRKCFARFSSWIGLNFQIELEISESLDVLEISTSNTEVDETIV